MEECINFAYSPGWAAPFFDDENNKNYCNFVAFLNILYVTELPEAFLALGTKLRLVLSFFTLRSDFMDLKKPLTFDEQLDKLAAHGMIIRDREKAKDILNL
mgnify:CR=1 FL=1